MRTASLPTLLVLCAILLFSAPALAARADALKAKASPPEEPKPEPASPPEEPKPEPASPPEEPKPEPASPPEEPEPASPPEQPEPASPPAETPASPPEAAVNRTFAIKDDQFWLNGEPTQLISGSIHYFRIRPEQWEDRLLRAKALGLNAIQTYIPWSLHEPSPGQYSFSGDTDFEAFVALAQSLDLLVLLRLGPYICGEYDLGGLPPWLLTRDPAVKIRSEDPQFLALVDSWWTVLLPKIAPLLWANGGPVVLVQIENEYGYYAVELGKKVNATAYLSHLANTTRTLLGEDVIIYTTDTANATLVGNGTINGTDVYTVIDAFLGTDWPAAFAIQKAFNAPGQSPPFISEFYSGWFSNWGEPLPTFNYSLLAADLATLLTLNASVNFYMAVGGTNFNFTSGANAGGDKHGFIPQITSYDYGAPIGEGGDTSSPFFETIRSVISEATNASLPDPPELPPRAALDTVNFTHSASLLDNADLLSPAVSAIWPKSMEYFGQNGGFILYTGTLPANLKELTIFGVKDRAQVWVTTPAAPGAAAGAGPVRRLAGVLERWVLKLKVPLAPAAPAPGDLVQVLVEDMGHINFGKYMKEDKKGVGAILGSIVPIFNWLVNPLNLTDLSPLPFAPVKPVTPDSPFEPTFFKASLEVDEPVDTFLNLTGWTKGVAWINGFNLGRYWPAKGPQGHLYIPAPLLKAGTNELILLELDAPEPSLSVSFSNSTDFSVPPVPLVPPTPAPAQSESLSILQKVLTPLLRTLAM